MSVTNRSINLPSLAGRLPEQWQWRSLDEACSGIFDCPHSTPILTASGPIVVRSQDVRTGVLRLEDAAHVSEATYRDRVARAEPTKGDLLYSREGTYFGIAAEVPKGVRVCLGQRMVLLRPDQDAVESRYLLYWLNSSIMAAHIYGHRDGTVAERLNMPTIRRLPVAVPPLSDQRAMAIVLGAFDDKIELNRYLTETLEAIIHTLFKSWFVDFDPVRARVEGRDSGLPPHVAKLFPDSFDDSDLGDMPAGWRVTTVDDVAEINARVLKASDLLPIIDYVEISEVTRGEITDIPRYERGTEPSRARRRLRHGDTVLSTVRPDRGAYFLCLRPPESLVASTGFAVLSPRAGHWAFLHAALTRREIGEELGRLADGGAYPAVRPELVRALPLVLPQDTRLLDAFEDIARPLFERCALNRRQSKTLAALRDALLPKLLSGELRVPEAERIVGKVL